MRGIGSAECRRELTGLLLELETRSGSGIESRRLVPGRNSRLATSFATSTAPDFVFHFLSKLFCINELRASCGRWDSRSETISQGNLHEIAIIGGSGPDRDDLDKITTVFINVQALTVVSKYVCQAICLAKLSHTKAFHINALRKSTQPL